MLGASVIPECQRVRSPVHSASEARRARNELLQRAQDRVALPRGQSLYVGGKTGVNVEHLFAGFRVSRDDRMFIFGVFLSCLLYTSDAADE